jgi:hypothetical protein
VTNKGVGGLLKKWGEGASLIRKEWKTREENDEGGKVKGGVVDAKGHRASKDDKMAVDEDEDDDDEEDEDEDDEEEEEEEEEEPDLETTPRMLPRRTIGVHSPSHPDTNDRDGDLTKLTESLDSLSIVPSSIRFGRGGKSGGFISRGQGRAKHGRGRGLPNRRDGYVGNNVTVTRQ